MKRKVTQEERDILLNNPELVMFEPYGAMKVHRTSLGKALILPFIIGAVFFVWGFLCPDFINEHPTLFAATGCIALVLASGFLPILYFILDDRDFKKAREEHYSKQLKMLLLGALDAQKRVLLKLNAPAKNLTKIVKALQHCTLPRSTS